MFVCVVRLACMFTRLFGLPLSVTDDLDDLLNKLDDERPKSVPSGKAGKQQSSSPAVPNKEEEGQSNNFEKFLNGFLYCTPHCRNLFRNSETFRWNEPGLHL